MTDTIDWNKPVELVEVKTGGVQPARVLCRDRKQVETSRAKTPVVALVTTSIGEEVLHYFKPDGTSILGWYKLRNVREKGQFFVIDTSDTRGDIFGPWDYEDDAFEWAKKQFGSAYRVRQPIPSQIG